MNLTEFIETNKNAIARELINSYPPLYRPSHDDRPLPPLLREPMGLQEDAIRGASLSLSLNRGTTIVGEMGTGKTFLALAAATMAGFKRPLVICPPHLTRKWQREVKITLPGIKAAIVSSTTDLERLRAYDPQSPLITIMSRERAKLSYRWKPAYLLHYAWGANRPSNNPHPNFSPTNLACPDCATIISDKDDIPLAEKDMERKRLFCRWCEAPLWSADRAGPARYPLAEYVKHHMPKFFDLLIADEFHEFKAKGSAQGIAAAILAEVCGKSLTLTGTLMGGYSSTLFHLLYRFSPDIREEFGYHDEPRWVQRYGFIEKKFTERDNTSTTFHGRSSRRRGYNTRIKEIPGITPASLFHLIGNTVFLRLADVTSALPTYEEHVSLVQLDTARPDRLPSQKEAYILLRDQLKAALNESLAKGSMHLLGTYLQALLAYPDASMKGETVYDPITGELIAHLPPLSAERLYPKEKALIDLIRAERLKGRRVLVYITHTDTRDITIRVQQALTDHGFTAHTLKATTVTSDKREQWLSDKVASGADVIITNPRLVQTGLDLIDFPTIVWFETDYSVYTMRQASRRSWRIGQNRPVSVIYMAYAESIQAEALNLIARKMKTSLAIEGDLPDDGLSAFGDDGKDLMYSLARKLLDADGPDDADLFGSNPTQTLNIDQLLADAQAAQDDSDQLLVDDDWPLPPPIPKPDLPLIPSEPHPDPAPALAAQPVPTAPPTLFPLEDFIALGPFNMKAPKGQKPQPGYSLFDWALNASKAGPASP